MKRGFYKIRLVTGMFALVSVIAISGETDEVIETVVPEASEEVLSSQEDPAILENVAPPQPDHSALLAHLDRAQAKLDAARIKLEQTSAGSDAHVQLDVAQKMLDQTRTQLLSKSGMGGLGSREFLIQILQNAQLGFDAAKKRLANQPGSESAIAALDASQQNLDNTKKWLEESDDQPSVAELPVSGGMQEMYDDARRMLEEVRTKIMSAPEINQQALEQLEAAERKLDEAYRQSAALGLVE